MTEPAFFFSFFFDKTRRPGNDRARVLSVFVPHLLVGQRNLHMVVYNGCEQLLVHWRHILQIPNFCFLNYE
jgi:hypothetical protein